MGKKRFDYARVVKQRLDKWEDGKEAEGAE